MSAQCPKITPQLPSHGAPMSLARRPFRWATKGRTREADLFRATVRALTQHLGSEPSPAQALSIGQLGWLQVHLAKLNEAALTADGLTENRLGQLLELHRLFARGLRELGMKEAPAEREAWNDILARMGAPETGEDA